MKEKILIVEDQFIEADFLRLMLTKAGYSVCSIARSVPQALEIIEKEKPGMGHTVAIPGSNRPI